MSRRATRTRPPAAATPATRPLRLLPQEQLEQRFAQALAAGDGLSGAHCIHEQWMRGQFAQLIERDLERLWSRAAASIPEWLPMRYVEWLPVAYEVAERLRARCRGRSNLYLVLLDFSDRRRGPFGVYVGMSGYAPAVRFDQHKAGIRAAGSVLKRGLEVLTGPTLHLQHIERTEAVQFEADLAAGLADAGLLVEGGH